jgi:hypothetical protein
VKTDAVLKQVGCVDHSYKLCDFYHRPPRCTNLTNLAARAKSTWLQHRRTSTQSPTTHLIPYRGSPQITIWGLYDSQVMMGIKIHVAETTQIQFQLLTASTRRNSQLISEGVIFVFVHGSYIYATSFLELCILLESRGEQTSTIVKGRDLHLYIPHPQVGFHLVIKWLNGQAGGPKGTTSRQC